MFYTIYKITNKINGKYYIGKHQTKDLDDGYMGSGKLLKRAVCKYGVENFDKEILHVFDNEKDMNDKEKELVEHLDSNTYNLCSGGQGGFGYINDNVWTEEKRLNHNKKYSPFKDFDSNFRSENAKKGMKRIRELYKEKFSVWSRLGGQKAFKGKSHSKETIIKMSESSKGQGLGSKNSQYGTMWITNGNESRKIKKLDIIPEGWYKGRKVSLG